MSDIERAVIWGSFPLADGEEILQAWNQIANRTNNTAVMNDRVPMMSDLGDRTTEYVAATPPIGKFVERRSEQVGEALHSAEAILAYRRGAADLLELLGTVQMNRQFEAITPEIEPPKE